MSYLIKTLKLLLIFLLILPLGCRPKANIRVQNAKIKVACTTGMVADVVTNVGGSNIEIYQLMGAGVDPHLYKPTLTDLNALLDADVIFYSGLHLEGKMAEVFHKLGKQKLVFAVSDSVPINLLRRSDNFGKVGGYDPHIWMSPAIWKYTANAVAAGLSAFDTLNAKKYHNNAIAYQKELNLLDIEIQNLLQALPPTQRVLITAHDAFSYYCARYNMTVKGLQGISTLAEFGLKDVNDMIDYIIKNRIKAIFVETSVPVKAIEAVVAGCNSANFNLKIGGSLYSDALGNKNTPEGTYIGMLRHNTRTIVTALK